jgi:hypothetical protein
MYEAQIIFIVIVEARGNAAKVLQPCNQAFDLPSAFITAQCSTVLRGHFLPIRLMWRNHLDTNRAQLQVQWVRVIGFVANQLCGRFTSETRRKSVVDKGDFMRASTRCVGGDRKTSIVCHHHEFRAFAPLSLTNSAPPFFAAMNVPSMKHSDKSSSPRVRRSSARASKTLRSVPSLTQAWNLRWQVWYGGNLSGKSFHRAPLRRIHRMPFITSRLPRHGLPRLSSRRGSSGRCASMTAHCSSVSSSPRAMRNASTSIYETASSINLLSLHTPASRFHLKHFDSIH